MSLFTISSASNFRRSYPSGPYVENVEKKKQPKKIRPEVLAVAERGKCIVLKIKYHNCTNFEGVKILVLKMPLIEYFNLPEWVDPHFTEESKLIARFHPNEWDMALRFAETMVK